MAMNAWTSEQFRQLDWAGIVDEAKSRECNRYAEVVRKRLADAGGESQQSLAVVEQVLSLHITVKEVPGLPLGPEHLLEAIPREALAALAVVVSDIADSEIRARILDAAWLKNRACSHRVPAGAVDNY